MVSETKPSNPSSGTKRLSHRRKQIYPQIIVGMIILFCGIVIGSGATLLRLKDRVIMHGPRPPLVAIVEDIRARYDLTQEQTEQAEDVLGKRRETMSVLFEEFREKIEAEFQELSMEMKDILSPEQYERWEHDFTTRRGRGPWRRGQEMPGPGRYGPERYGQRRYDAERYGPGKPGLGRPGPRRPGLREPNSTPQ